MISNLNKSCEILDFLSMERKTIMSDENHSFEIKDNIFSLALKNKNDRKTYGHNIKNNQGENFNINVRKTSN